jgi:hypothetical protein
MPNSGVQAAVPLQQAYPKLSLDSITASATYFVGQWTPDLKRNQSRDLLRLVLSKMWFPCHGNLFNGRIRASDAALADALDLSREWTNTLKGRLCDAKWLETSAPRLPDGKQEITIYRPGKRLKRLLVMLLRSTQRQKNRVNTSSQKVPTEQERAKNKARFAGLIEEVGKKLGMKT